MNIKQMEAKLKKLKKQAARLDKEIYELDGKLWNAKVAAVKPENLKLTRFVGVPGVHNSS